MARIRFEPDTLQNKCAKLGLGNSLEFTLLQSREHRYQQTAVKHNFLFLKHFCAWRYVPLHIVYDNNGMYRIQVKTRWQPHVSTHIRPSSGCTRCTPKRRIFLRIIVYSLSRSRYVPKHVTVNCTFVIKICVWLLSVGDFAYKTQRVKPH
jgi:hypothetical protein